MSVVQEAQVPIVPPQQQNITADDISRYLLQYILAARGVCHENALMLALMRLKVDSHDVNAHWTISDWLEALNEHINAINIKLNLLNYKILRISHGIGKSAVSIKNRQNFGLFDTVGTTEDNEDDDNNDNKEDSRVVLPESNRFYVYVNLSSTEETKLATRFTPKEIEYVKWCLEKFCIQSGIIREMDQGNAITSSIVVHEVNRILLSATGDNTTNKWNKWTTFTLGSTELLQYDGFTATEIEAVLVKLCEHKWFYRTQNGVFGMDLKCIAELEEYLVSTFELATCQNCNKLAIQGVMCGSESCLQNGSPSSEGESTNKCRVWHIDCFQHYITHVSKDCDLCKNSLITNGVYVI
ncbi:hypothetical protein NCAS_0A01450 [Naumovozyma castellii]|uniref:Non-structural maintenance of chromosomes element 1 homolog n=1 Tax=Naumovozyma castellii TaxID=27288 RepID=G0V5G7_NAUCA|nr:hypothetical protein NCAS_0A01450 [Naumovozyma castellii CBS 4309]CCC66703.1 hypothetical protein NCAS_0A01450 [Naumovozyma castellii CBS 4309]